MEPSKLATLPLCHGDLVLGHWLRTNGPLSGSPHLLEAKKGLPHSRDCGGFALVPFGLGLGHGWGDLDMVIGLWIALEMLGLDLKVLLGRDRD